MTPAQPDRRGSGPAATTRDAGASGSPAPATSTPAPLGPHQIEIRLTERSWLRVAIDGNTALEGIFPAGTTRTFTGKVADVRAGNAGGVTVGLNGRPPAPMGKEGDVVEQRYPL